MGFQGVKVSIFLLFSVVFASYDLKLDKRSNPVEHVDPTPSKKWTVELEEGANADEIAKRHGFINKGLVPFTVADNHYIFEEGDGDLQHLKTAREVVMHENHLYRQRHKRYFLSNYDEEEEFEDILRQQVLNSLVRGYQRRAQENLLKSQVKKSLKKRIILESIQDLEDFEEEINLRQEIEIAKHWYKNHRNLKSYIPYSGRSQFREKKSYDPVINSEEDLSTDEDDFVLADEDDKSSTFPDPLYHEQWHLHGFPGLDLNVPAVWKSGITGRGIQIAIVDDGVDREHPDLKINFNYEGSYDYNDHKEFPDPNPRDEFNSHGTSAAAVAGAGINNYCGIGVAPNSRIAGIRMVAAPVSDHEEANALVHRKDLNHIYSSSWGPTDDGQRMEGPARLTQLAMKEGIVTGRNGSGIIYIWACGNGGSRGDNCNYDGFANSRYALSIGSVTVRGKHAPYSELCASLDAVTPSSGGSKGITTTALKDLHEGCTNKFGGTSASSPMAAGIVALMLEANPALTWRDVQGVVHLSSSKIDPLDSDWMQNGAGLWVSHKYGFGLMDALKAVETSQSWINYPTELSVDSGTLSVETTVDKEKDLSYQVTDNITVLHVEVKFDCHIQQRGDLQVVIYSPSGLQSRVHEYHDDNHPNVVNWTYTSKRYWHEKSKGVWKVVVSTRSTSTVTIHSWGLKLYGF